MFSIVVYLIPFFSSGWNKLQFVKHEELSAETRSLLVAEIKSHNRQFPVNRFYNQLAAKRNEVDPAGGRRFVLFCRDSGFVCAISSQKASNSFFCSSL